VTITLKKARRINFFTVSVATVIWYYNWSIYPGNKGDLRRARVRSMGKFKLSLETKADLPEFAGRGSFKGRKPSLSKTSEGWSTTISQVSIASASLYFNLLADNCNKVSEVCGSFSLIS
jgi:hypothetical protein